jgi:ribonuclease HI
MPPFHILSLQVALVEDPTLTFVSCPPLNPATLLPLSSTPLVHSCPEILEELLPCPDHIQEVTLSQADYTWFIDGSSFIPNGQRRAGYAIMSDSTIIEAHSLPLGTTSQRAELTALARALTLAKDKTVNIYADSKYVFHTSLSHSVIWKKRGFLTTRGTPIINAALIAQILEVSHLPSWVGITHCKAYQTDSSIITTGNNRADTEAKCTALQTAPQLAMHPLTPASAPQSEVKTLLSYLHMLFHPNLHAFYTFLCQSFSLSPGDILYLKQITQSCSICQCTNPNSNIRPPPFPTHQARGCLPGMDWQVDFTHVPPVKRIKYLLVLVDTFTGWVEAFPTTNTKASTVTILVTDIISWFVLLGSIQSDNRPEFVSSVSQK